MSSSSTHRQHLSSYLNKHKSRTSVESASTVKSTSDKPLSSSGNNGETNTQRLKREPGRRKIVSHRRPPPLIRGKASIDYLPCEILIEIFSFLEAQDLLKAACVCKKWHEIANDNLLWEEIFKTHGAVGGKTEQRERPPLSYWKQLCIKRCTEKRNKPCLKLLKKIHPYTGLPRDTEKALRTAGVTFDLCLTDTDGRDHVSPSQDVFYHSMSAAVRWHSLSTVPLLRVKRIKVYSHNPLFFDEKGKAVKSGPYQSSMMTSVDLKWSNFVKDARPLGEDETVKLYAVPGVDMIIATWKADGEMAFVVTSFHFNNLVKRCLLGSRASAFPLPIHKPIPDDIDPSYGLHHYKCNVEVRNVRTSLWSQQFQGLHCQKQNIADGNASLSLIRRDTPSEHVIIPKAFTLLWKTELFKGAVKNTAWLDVTLLDEREEVFWALSSPFTAKENEKSKNFDYNGETHLTASFQGERGRVELELSQMDDDRTFVAHLEVKIAISTINDWFQTCY